MSPSKKSDPTALSSAAIRQGFLDFFAERGHTIVPSASLVPGGDETLLFTNSGMVQFKDIFLGSGKRAYTRAVDSQKCMRVAGKHNDLDDVGRDDIHHTFFEMLGNWSFGDYYKQEAISWAWTLLTEVWDLPKEHLYAACFEDEMGQIPRDDEAADLWRAQPGFDPEHVLFFGRKENFWEMAETGPCGPDSEIHLDRGPEYCDMQDVKGHVCQVNGQCQRFLELWNLVFIQYNRLGPDELEPLPAKHVDTGMGFERIVSVLQGVRSNYETDLFQPLLDRVQSMAGHTDDERAALLTPYRVIADHARAATFLIADGVVPGNTGRNYVCRMIIRRASRFGTYAGFEEPFLAGVAQTVIDDYGDAYPEIRRNRDTIVKTITNEERRFHRTVEAGVAHLMDNLRAIEAAGGGELSGQTAFDLYATYGLPFEITRDIAREQDIEVDGEGFSRAMETHREVSSAENGDHASDASQVDAFRALRERLKSDGRLGDDGVAYDPYYGLETEGNVLALVVDGQPVQRAAEGQSVTVVLPATSFYIESGGQVSDTGSIVSVDEPRWRIRVDGVQRPVTGLVVHLGVVERGEPAVGDLALAAVDHSRRMDIMRNHTATHLLHAALQAVLGRHARQAGSLVAPDRLRFDFNHPEAMTRQELDRVETLVNDAVLEDFTLHIEYKPREEAIDEGAMALFGENYGETVRTIQIGDPERLSYELCGGTHVPSTGVIGPFVIISESSAAAGIRRIEALTGRGALDWMKRRRDQLGRLAESLHTSPDAVPDRVAGLIAERDALAGELEASHAKQAMSAFAQLQPADVAGVPVLAAQIPEADGDLLRTLADRFREKHPSGVVVLASDTEGRPIFVAAVTKDLVARGLHAGQLAKAAAERVGGGGGGRPTLAQAGGVDSEHIPDALALVPKWVAEHLD
jgi:alanyl-tRNA synthetase